MATNVVNAPPATTKLNYKHRVVEAAILHGDKAVILLPPNTDYRAAAIHFDNTADITLDVCVAPHEDVIATPDSTTEVFWANIASPTARTVLNGPATAIRIANGHASQTRNVQVLIG